MIDYANYFETTAKTYETAQESISFAPIVLSKKLLILSSIFLILIILNVFVALRVSMLNYNISNQEKLLKNLQIEKTALLNQIDSIKSADKELQEANKFGLKPINTDQIRFYQ